ncbi:unnamed protein product [Lupinus luteus]|uniref:GDSL esterase/lipase n=1 Tax=Lupinus luteus TaxID=3873 RepID=A0AAV1VRY8_LUPLU
MALLLLFIILAISAEVEGAKKSNGLYDNDNSVKLFVFGDSYVDTGNFLHSTTYKPPSGMTFPGYPDGRFGNGRVMTDYFGAEKIVVSLLQPIGCLPTISVASLYIDCIHLLNLVSRGHNKMLLGNVEDLNKEIGKPIFRTLDLYNSFLSAIQTIKKNRKENSTIMNPLEPCCALESVGYDCGKVDEKG